MSSCLGIGIQEQTRQAQTDMTECIKSLHSWVVKIGGGGNRNHLRDVGSWYFTAASRVQFQIYA